MPNTDGDDGVVQIKTLLEMLTETRSLSKMSFIKDMDFDNLPQRVVRFSPREFNGDIMFGLPRLEYTAYVVNMNMLFKMDWRYDGHV